jgi:iron-sulfur cluster assembly accessory protein
MNVSTQRRLLARLTCNERIHRRLPRLARALCGGPLGIDVILLRLYVRPMIAGKLAAATVGSAAPSFRVGDERLIKVLPNAARKVSSLLTRQGRPTGVLRVAVIGGGCSGMQYKMDLQDAPANRDILVESNGVKVVVDPKSALYVTGSELDYIDALQGGGFKVTNPNAATTCSCGESFSA